MTKIIDAASPKHCAQMERLGNFLGLKSISYTDHGKRETYVLERQDGAKLAIKAWGNQYDGGYLAVGYMEENDDRKQTR